jgi:hypothetical protein
MNFSSVPENEWVIAINDSVRCKQLSASLSTSEISSYMAAQAMQVSATNGICLRWEEAIEKPSYWRANVKISIQENLFDQLFNGRSGYRAQYYLSVHEGENFNRSLVDTLIPAIRKAYEIKPLENATWLAVEASLKGRYSKIGVKNGNAYEREKTLVTPRWKDSEWGSRLLATFPPQVDVLGTFVQLNNFSDDWIDDCKKDRPCDMHKKGFS